jgi:xanthine dehydrogenase accessory factor
MAPDILDLAAQRKSKGEPFALATVVRTLDVTAAKAGAKALIGLDGSISEGWIGGGCARAAVLKAAREAMTDGKARLVSIQPEDLLTEQGLAAGDDHEGVQFANNFCPSKGTMDVFVEPILPKPALLVLGASPIAVSLADLATNMGFDVSIGASKDDLARFGPVASKFEGFEIPPTNVSSTYVVVSTQGAGDRAALKAAAALDAKYIAFVGSRRKAAKLRDDLAIEGVSRARLDAVKAPAGLDIGAITTEEIALSIVTEMIAIRRANRGVLARGHEAKPTSKDY